MKQFMDADFLLHTPFSRKLYHNYAEKMPILDYHCHIDPREIAEDRHYDNITQLWLGGDHYKWRQMRSNGIDERYITGDASDYEKFVEWSKTLEKAIGNPLYHWSHLELQRYFGYHGILSEKTAPAVWKLCNEQLQTLSVRQIIAKSGVTLICTTDDPADTLEWHEQLACDQTFQVQVLPAWRPDQAMHIERSSYLTYLDKLSRCSGISVHDYASLLSALHNRLDYFGSHGCMVSDHALEYIMYAPSSRESIARIFDKRMRGESLSAQDILLYKTAFLQDMSAEYRQRGWVMQLHYGCKRDNNSAAWKALGPDTGYDCIGDTAPASQTADFLDSLAEKGNLPKTILYSLNPGDTAANASIIGCFQNSDAIGKLQLGAAWWFNDHKAGMTEQLTTLADLGLLGNFIGMLTDSRSFLSYTRHEYFRRILCNLIGDWVENGEVPNDESALGELIKNISYNNAIRYFGFRLETK